MDPEQASAEMEEDDIALASACLDEIRTLQILNENDNPESESIPMFGLGKALKNLSCEPPSQGSPSAPKVSTYILGKVSGYRPLSVNGQACIQCWARAVRQSEPRLDGDLLKIHKCFVKHGASFHSRTMVVRAEEMGMARATLETKLLRLASGYHVFFCRAEWALFQQYLIGSQHPSPNVKNLCTFEPQIWLEIITSRDAQSTCFKGSQTSCTEIISAVFWPNFGRKKSDHVMDAAC